MPDDLDIDGGDPTRIPPGAVIVPEGFDDSVEADQGADRPDKATQDELVGIAWTAAQEAVDAGLIAPPDPDNDLGSD